MIPRYLPIALLLATAIHARGQGIVPPEVPAEIKAPAGEQVVLVAHATGSQIYTCQVADGKYAWTLKAPDAELHDAAGALIGKHFAGPTWKSNDGSEVKGKAAAHVDSPDKDAIPWLLVKVTEHSGDGVLSRVSSIQRIHTKGGRVSSSDECNASKQNTEVKSSYTADYYFFAPAK